MFSIFKQASDTQDVVLQELTEDQLSEVAGGKAHAWHHHHRRHRHHHHATWTGSNTTTTTTTTTTKMTAAESRTVRTKSAARIAEVQSCQ